jgi:hypothetical protein
MLPFGNGLLGAAGPYALPIAAQSYTGSSTVTSAVLSSLGAQAGDMCLIGGSPGRDAPTINGTALPVMGYYLYWKVLIAADLAYPVVCSNGDFILDIYRGPTSISLVGNQVTTTPGTNSMPGLVKSLKHMGLVALGGGQNNTNVIRRPQNPVAWPVAVTFSRVFASSMYMTFTHLLPRLNYPIADNVPITWNTNVSNSIADIMTIIELRR